jgi:hypothetical protein
MVVLADNQAAVAQGDGPCHPYDAFGVYALDPPNPAIPPRVFPVSAQVTAGPEGGPPPGPRAYTWQHNGAPVLYLDEGGHHLLPVRDVARDVAILTLTDATRRSGFLLPYFGASASLWCFGLIALSWLACFTAALGGQGIAGLVLGQLQVVLVSPPVFANLLSSTVAIGLAIPVVVAVATLPWRHTRVVARALTGWRHTNRARITDLLQAARFDWTYHTDLPLDDGVHVVFYGASTGLVQASTGVVAAARFVREAGGVAPLWVAELELAMKHWMLSGEITRAGDVLAVGQIAAKLQAVLAYGGGVDLSTILLPRLSSLDVLAAWPALTHETLKLQRHRFVDFFQVFRSEQENTEPGLPYTIVLVRTLADLARYVGPHWSPFWLAIRVSVLLVTLIVDCGYFLFVPPPPVVARQIFNVSIPPAVDPRHPDTWHVALKPGEIAIVSIRVVSPTLPILWSQAELNVNADSPVLIDDTSLSDQDGRPIPQRSLSLRLRSEETFMVVRRSGEAGANVSVLVRDRQGRSTDLLLTFTFVD